MIGEKHARRPNEIIVTSLKQRAPAQSAGERLARRRCPDKVEISERDPSGKTIAKIRSKEGARIGRTLINKINTDNFGEARRNETAGGAAATAEEIKRTHRWGVQRDVVEETIRAVRRR